MMPDFVLGFGLVALVLIATGLISGIVERSRMSFSLMFLGLGLALGGGGLGVIELDPYDELLKVVATLTLSLVLFLAAVKLDVKELGRKWVIPLLILGPGTLRIIAIGFTRSVRPRRAADPEAADVARVPLGRLPRRV